MPKLETICAYCGNEVDSDTGYCYKCKEYDGAIVGYYNNKGEFIERGK